MPELHIEKTRSEHQGQLVATDDSGITGRPPIGRWALGVLAGVLAFFLVGALLRWGLDAIPDLRLEEPGVHRLKATHLDAHLDELDVVFVGSSHVYREVATRLFDRLNGLAGQPTESYNYGLPGMRFPEMLAVARRIADARPAKLKWLVLELEEPMPEFSRASQFTRRSVHWHTPEVTAFVCRMLLVNEDRSLLKKIEELGIHLGQLVLYLGNVAKGLPAARALLGMNVAREDPLRGYLPLDRDPNPESRARREELLAHPKRLDRKRAHLLEEREPRQPEKALLDVLASLVAHVRDAGIEPIFLICPPAKDLHTPFLEAHEQGVLPNLFAYHDPVRFPRFYDPSFVFDINHLNHEGGKELTRLFAKDFQALDRMAPPARDGLLEGSDDEN